MKTEKIIVGQGTEYPLDGLLVLPDNISVPVPAVVLVHGSGPSDKDERIMKITPFKDLAEGLAKYGVASLRYDKRTFAYGRKMANQKDITVYGETIEDALRAAEILRQDSRIRQDGIFIIGHSMGAMLAPRIDAEGGNFRGLILMAGSLRRLDEILISQTEEMYESSGFPMRLLFGAMLKKYRKLFSNLESVSLEESKNIKAMNGIMLYYFREMAEHPAAEYLKAEDKPVLILQGEMDCQARKVPDYQGYTELLKDKDNVTFRLYPGLNHLFTASINHSILKIGQDYKGEKHIPEYVIRDIGEWIRSSCL